MKKILLTLTIFGIVGCANSDISFECDFSFITINAERTIAKVSRKNESSGKKHFNSLFYYAAYEEEGNNFKKIQFKHPSESGLKRAIGFSEKDNQIYQGAINCKKI
jgi:hypothetical protein